MAAFHRDCVTRAMEGHRSAQITAAPNRCAPTQNILHQPWEVTYIYTVCHVLHSRLTATDDALEASAASCQSQDLCEKVLLVSSSFFPLLGTCLTCLYWALVNLLCTSLSVVCLGLGP